MQVSPRGQAAQVVASFFVAWTQQQTIRQRRTPLAVVGCRLKYMGRSVGGAIGNVVAGLLSDYCNWYEWCVRVYIGVTDDSESHCECPRMVPQPKKQQWLTAERVKECVTIHGTVTFTPSSHVNLDTTGDWHFC